MQTYRPPVRMMANGGDVGEISQRNIYSDIYQDLLGYYGKERDEKIYGLSDKYGMTPGEVLNAYQEGSNMTETRSVPLGTSKGSDPVDIPEGRSSFLNLAETLVGDTVYNAVEDSVVDPAIQYAGKRLEVISPENRGTLGQDVFNKGFFGPPAPPRQIYDVQGRPIEEGSPSGSPPAMEGEAYWDQVKAVTGSLGRSLNKGVVEPFTDTMEDLGVTGVLGGLTAAASDKSAVARAVMDLEGSRQRAALEAGADPTIQQSPFDRALGFAKKTLAGDSEEINIEDLAEELDDYFKQSFYETSSSQQRNESSPQRIMIGKLGPERQGRLARAIAAGEEFKTAESIDEFFKDDEGYEELAAAAKGAAAKGAAADEEKKDKDAVKVVAPNGAVEEGVAPDGAGEEGGDLPERKPAPPKLEKAAMDAVASGSIDSFLDKLSQKDLLAMAVGFLGATSVTAGTKAALANLLKSKEAAEALALAKQKAANDRDFLSVRYGNQSAGVTQRTAAILNTINKDNPLFGTPLEYKSKFRMANGEEPPKYGSPAHLFLQAQSNDKVTRLYGLSAGGGAAGGAVPNYGFTAAGDMI